MRPEICRSLHVLKHHCDGNEMCAFIGLHGNNCYECFFALLMGSSLCSPEFSPCDYNTIPPAEQGTAWETIYKHRGHLNSIWAQCGAY